MIVTKTYYHFVKALANNFLQKSKKNTFEPQNSSNPPQTKPGADVTFDYNLTYLTTL